MANKLFLNYLKNRLHFPIHYVKIFRNGGIPMANDIIFKTKAFGGFNKEEVMTYINRLISEKSVLETKCKELTDANDDLKLQKAITTRMRLDVFPEDKQPNACISCGLCAENCPQKIKVPEEISKLNEILNSMPTWAQVCEERNRKMKS